MREGAVSQSDPMTSRRKAHPGDGILSVGLGSSELWPDQSSLDYPPPAMLPTL